MMAVAAFSDFLRKSGLAQDVCWSVRRVRDPVSRFVEKVSPQPNGCIEWIGSKSPDGYGWISWKSKPVLAHRWAYAASHGPIPTGKVIDHLCRNPSCVNPLHLECVSMRTNTARGVLHDEQRAKAKRQTRCKRGHDLFGTNLITNNKGNRSCKTCQQMMAKAWCARNRDRINENQRARRACLSGT